MIIKQTVPGLADSLVIPLENEIRELNKEIDTLHTTYQSVITDLNVQIEGLNTSIIDKDSVINNQSEQIEVLQISNSELQEEVDELQSKLSDAEISEDTKFAYSSFTKLSKTIKDYIEQSKDCSYMLANTLIEGELELNLANATDISNMFKNDTNSEHSNNLTKITLNISNPVIAERAFGECAALENVVINSSITDPRSLFSGCTNLKSINGNMDFSNAQVFYMTFYNCKSLEAIPNIDFTNATTLQYAFQNSGIKYLPKMNTINVTNVTEMVKGCAKLERIEELIVDNVDYIDLTGWGSIGNVRYALFKGIGKQAKLYQAQFNFNNWGVANEKHPDARQSVIDSLITYSYDRATAGYSSVSISLFANTKALLTQDEVAQITAKGYTIA